MADVYKKISEYNELAELDASGKMLVAQSDETYSVGADTMADFVRRTISVDRQPTEDSENLVKSGGIYDALTKIGQYAFTPMSAQTTDKLLVVHGVRTDQVDMMSPVDLYMDTNADAVPVQNSRKIVKSGGVYNAIEEVRALTETDDTLSVEDKPADAKATGDQLNLEQLRIENSVYHDELANFNWSQGGVSVSTGATSSVSNRKKAYHVIGATCRLTCDSNHRLWVYVYSSRTPNRTYYQGRISIDGTLRKDGDAYDEQDVWIGNVPKTYYMYVVMSRTDDTAISTSEDGGFKAWRCTDVNLELAGVPADGQAAGRVLYQETSWGQHNAMESARQMLDIEWTPTAATMPNNNGGYFAQSKQTGIPYSSVRDADKAVGLNVSFKTFMTAVRDPRSVLYTRRSNSSNASTYYGSVCSGVMNYAYGIGLNLTNYYLGESDLFETIPMQMIQPGDMLFTDGHVAMVGAAPRDKWGRITSVTVWEEWVPNGRDVSYSSWDSFLRARPNYIARRFKALDGVGYTAIPYVQCFDEEPVEITYPDVQTDHGDGAVFVTGETVTVHVIDPKSYTQIAVTKDGTSVLTRTSITDFTITNVQPGLYTITATGGGNESVSEFFVADVHGSFNASTGEVTFSSSNATPVLVNTYGWPVANNAVRCYPLPLTDEDRARGSVNVSDLLTMDNPQAKVTFMTPYGTADWRSEYHQTWEAIE